MKKLLIVALTIIMLLSLTISTHANPYGLYGRGNCVYFTFECIDRFWEWTPNIPREWDACEWINLVGWENESYKVIQAAEPLPGDVFILPATEDSPRGHNGFILEVGRDYWFSDGTYEEYYRVYESSMYADDLFKLELGSCRYRTHYYWQEDFESATFLRCVEK